VLRITPSTSLCGLGSDQRTFQVCDANGEIKCHYAHVKGELMVFFGKPLTISETEEILKHIRRAVGCSPSLSSS